MIYISLTTVPLRLELWELLEEHLISLLNQKTSYDYQIIINIPFYYKITNEEYIIPDKLYKLVESNSKLHINRVKVDWGPMVKFLGTLEISTDPDDIIIVLDDDQYYHEDMIEYHMKKRKEYPDCGIVFQGDSPVKKIEWTENGVKKYRLDPIGADFPVKEDTRLYFPGHWKSGGYKRSFFKDDFFDPKFLSLATNDDVLVAYYFKKNEIPIMCVAWDKETDFRPIHMRDASFPIKFTLDYQFSSGFYEYRKLANNINGWYDDDLMKFMNNNDIIYLDKTE